MYKLSLASGVLPECSPSQVVHAAQQSGYDYAGLMIEPEQFGEREVAALQRELDGMPILDVEVVWIRPGESLDRGRAIMDVGAALGARNVLVVSMDEPAATRRAFEQLCEAAVPEMRVVLEFMMFSAVKSLEGALSVVRDVGHPAGGVLIDSLHIARSGEPLAAVADVPPALLPYVQFCDGLADCERTDEALIRDAVDDRSAPGEGDLAPGRLLDYVGPAVPLSLEVRSRAYRERFPEPVARARAVRDATLNYLNQMEIQS